MNVLLLIFASAVLLAAVDILSKKSLQHRHSIAFNAARGAWSLLLLLLIAPFILTPIAFREIVIIFIISILLTAEVHFYYKALRHLDISIASPLMELTPLFLLILAMLFLHERLHVVNIAGIILIVSGAFLLNLDLSAFKEKVKGHYVLLAVLAAALGGVVATLQKFSIATVPPLVLGWWLWVFVNVLLIIFSVVQHGFKELFEEVKQKHLFTISVLGISSNFAFLLALPLAFVSIVLPLRRISILFSVIAGGELFKEKHVLLRSIATFIMLGGTVLLIL
ncbi:MAG: DMT family transporter [archaeon]